MILVWAHCPDIQLLNVRLAFSSELTHYYLTLAWVRQVPYFNPPNEWILTVRLRGNSNHHNFMMLWWVLNHLLPELQASALTTHPLNSCNKILETDVFAVLIVCGNSINLHIYTMKLLLSKRSINQRKITLHNS